MRKFILPFLAIAMLGISCSYVMGKRVKGSGKVTTEKRAVSGYKSIDVSGAIEVYVKNDSVQQVTVVTDDNLQEYVTVTVEGNTVNIHPKRNFRLKPTDGIKVYVSGPDFKNFDASGACDFYSENKLSGSEAINISMSGSCEAKLELKTPKVTGNLSGSCSVSLTGETKEMEMDGSGSVDLKCFNLLAEKVIVDISGSGDAEVFASVELEVHVSGSGSILYKGNPKINQSISGSGSVKKAD
jgi:hypothetical protein